MLAFLKKSKLELDFQNKCVTLSDLENENSSIHNVSIHRNLHYNRRINECSKKQLKAKVTKSLSI